MTGKMPACRRKRPLSLKLLHLFDGLRCDERAFASVIKFPVRGRRKSGIRADDELRMSKVLHDLLFQRS